MTERDRLKREGRFHDQWAGEIDVTALEVDRAFEGATSPENRYLLGRMGDLSGKTVLDLGCGAGETSVYFARQGARVTAGDWSEGMLETAQKLAARFGVSLKTKKTNAMDLGFPKDSFDVVYAANLLHHVEVEPAIREMHRVARPGGLVCTWDPLRHNPVINLYRKIAKDVRTPDEHPLDIRIIRVWRNLFSRVDYDTFWLATLWIFLRFFLIERVDPNQERYWKKILKEEPRLKSTYLRLEKGDRLIKRLPYLDRFAWNIAIAARK